MLNIFSMYRKFLSLKTRLFLSKNFFFLSCLSFSLSVTSCLLFVFAHWARNYHSGNLKPALFFLALAFLSYYCTHYFAVRYLNKDQYNACLYVTFTSGIYSVLAKINLAVLSVMEAPVEYKLIEYCGDWLFWLFMIYLVWRIIFRSSNYDETYKKIDSERKKDKK